MPSYFLFSTFVTFTLRFISTLRCSEIGFTSFQQFKEFCNDIVFIYRYFHTSPYEVLFY